MTAYEQAYCVALGDECGVRVKAVTTGANEYAVRLPGLRGVNYLVTSIHALAVEWIEERRRK